MTQNQIMFHGETITEYYMYNTYCISVRSINTMPFPEFLIKAIEHGKGKGFEYRECVVAYNYITLVFSNNR